MPPCPHANEKIPLCAACRIRRAKRDLPITVYIGTLAILIVFPSWFAFNHIFTTILAVVIASGATYLLLTGAAEILARYLLCLLGWRESRLALGVMQAALVLAFCAMGIAVAALSLFAANAMVPS